MVSRMSIVDKGKVVPNGNSRAIRLSANFARLYGLIEIGDEWEIREEDGKLVLSFPKEQGEKEEIFK